MNNFSFLRKKTERRVRGEKGERENGTGEGDGDETRRSPNNIPPLLLLLLLKWKVQL